MPTSRRKRTFFQKVCQAFGVVMIGWAIYSCLLFAGAILRGDSPVGLGLFMILIKIGTQGGIGLLLIVFDPHKVIQAIGSLGSLGGLSRLVEQRSSRPSFADRIGADDDEDE